jgi:hypothetical protein
VLLSFSIACVGPARRAAVATSGGKRKRSLSLGSDLRLVFSVGVLPLGILSCVDNGEGVEQRSRTRALHVHGVVASDHPVSLVFS